MVRLACLAVATALVLSPDVSGDSAFPAIPAEPATDQSAPATQPASGTAAGPQQQTAKNDAPLQEESRMMILRSVDGEFARMLTPLPGGKKGFHFRAGEPIDQNALRKAIQSSGAALNTGDNVQITKLEFQGKEILVDLNGGGRKQGSWQDHVQMQDRPSDPAGADHQPDDEDGRRRAGAFRQKDRGDVLPGFRPHAAGHDAGPSEAVSERGAGFLEAAVGSGAMDRDAAAQDAGSHREKRAEVGMDRDEVLAAMGRPDRKVREQEAGRRGDGRLDLRPSSRKDDVRAIHGRKGHQIDSYPN